MLLGWAWTLQCLGAPLAPPASWGRCCGTVPQVSRQLCPPPACPMLAVLSSWGCPCSQLRFPAGVCGCQRGVVSLLSVPAGCDFNELPPGLTPVCLHRAGVAAVACAVTTGNASRALAAAVGFFLGHILLRGCCAA